MNIYYDPAKFELEIIHSLDEDNLCYEYNTFLVFLHTPSGRVFYASDSGCSCPTPFEEYNFKGPDDNNLNEVKKGHEMETFASELENWCKDAKISVDVLDKVLTDVRMRVK